MKRIKYLGGTRKERTTRDMGFHSRKNYSSTLKVTSLRIVLIIKPLSPLWTYFIFLSFSHSLFSILLTPSRFVFPLHFPLIIFYKLVYIYLSMNIFVSLWCAYTEEILRVQSFKRSSKNFNNEYYSVRNILYFNTRNQLSKMYLFLSSWKKLYFVYFCFLVNIIIKWYLPTHLSAIIIYILCLHVIHLYLLFKRVFLLIIIIVISLDIHRFLLKLKKMTFVYAYNTILFTFFYTTLKYA